MPYPKACKSKHMEILDYNSVSIKKERTSCLLTIFGLDEIRAATNLHIPNMSVSRLVRTPPLEAEYTS